MRNYAKKHKLFKTQSFRGDFNAKSQVLSHDGKAGNKWRKQDVNPQNVAPHFNC